VAAEYSDDTDTRYQGGDLGWLSISALPATIPSAAASLADGQITEPCDVPGGIAIFLSTGTRNPPTTTPEALRPKVRGELIAARRAAAAKNWKASLREAAKVEILNQPPSVLSTDADGSQPAPPPLLR
jgi:parvulin-like peptidyl-prolyl isomerase